MPKQEIVILVKEQALQCFEDGALIQTYSVSTGKNGVGEQLNSECTPRGRHCVHEVIGRAHAENSVFVARVWTGEIYTEALAGEFPERDWILTRIVRLEGLEPGEPFGTKSSSAPVSTNVSEISGCQASSHIGEPILILPIE